MGEAVDGFEEAVDGFEEARYPRIRGDCRAKGLAGAESKWPEVLSRRAFAAREPCTGDREKVAGIPHAAYFFVGCGAYPDGLVGFVLQARRMRC
jgi:hypothetical protein